MSHQCQQCFATFTFKHNLKRHVEKRCKNIPINSQNIAPHFQNVPQLYDGELKFKNAFVRLTNSNRYECVRCKKQISCKSKRYHYDIACNGLNVLQCKYCKTMLSSSKNKSLHQKKCVNNEPASSIKSIHTPCPQCSECGKTFKRNYNLKLHKASCNGFPSLQCNICMKVFSSRQGKYHHKRKVKCTPPSSIKSIHTPSSTAAPPHPNVSALTHIYLIREREFIRMNEPIFKLGRSSNIKNRCGSYPKNSEIIIILQVGDSVQVEKELLKQFKQLFSQRRDIGDEYFAGDKAHMILTMCNHVYKDTPGPLST